MNVGVPATMLRSELVFSTLMIRRLLVSVLLIAGGFAAGLAVNSRARVVAESSPDVVYNMRPAGAAEQTQIPRAASQPTRPASFGGPDFTSIAGQAVKAVANISSLQVVRAPNSPFANDPFFRSFFGDNDIFGTRDRRSLSLGSGVMISADGYIVTNNHVVGENV